MSSTPPKPENGDQNWPSDDSVGGYMPEWIRSNQTGQSPVDQPAPTERIPYEEAADRSYDGDAADMDQDGQGRDESLYDDSGEPYDGDPETAESKRRWGRRIGAITLAAVLVGGIGGVAYDKGVNHGKYTNALMGVMTSGEDKTTNAAPVQIVAPTPSSTAVAPVVTPGEHDKTRRHSHRGDRRHPKSPESNTTTSSEAEPTPSTTASPETTVPSPAATATAPVVPASPKPEQPSEAACIRQLPDEFKIGQMVMVGVASADITPTFTKAFADNNIGGLTVMTQPAAAPKGQLNAVQKLAAAADIPPLVSTDQEGGGVQRFVSKSVTSLPWADQMPTMYTPDEATALYEANYAYVKAQGVNMMLGPVADLAPAAGVTDELPHRQYSTNPSVASEYVEANLAAAKAAEVLATAKHFPGGTIKNTDVHSATVKPLADLEKSDWLVFKEAAKPKYKAAAMMSNSIVPNLTNGQPASLSKAANEAAREMGFKYTVTDALNAKSISLPLNQAVVKALEAGNNVALFVDPSNGAKLNEEMDAIQTFAAAEIKAGHLTEKQLDQDFRGLLLMKRAAGLAVHGCELADRFKATAKPPVQDKVLPSPSSSASVSVTSSASASVSAGKTSVRVSSQSTPSKPATPKSAATK